MSRATRQIRGVAVPRFLYGTAWKEERTEALVRQALAAGFTGIDTANQRKHYHEAGVGAGIADWLADGRRDELFLQTKFTFQRGQDHRLPYDPTAAIATQVEQSFASSLEHLGVDHLDSLVLHGPSVFPGLGPDDHEAWGAIEGLAERGGTRLVGISNVAPDQLAELLRFCSRPPDFVQNRCYATRGWDEPVRAICRAHGIVYQGFSLLTANRQVWGHPIVGAIAARHRLTPAQVLFATALALDILPLTGTTDPAHMQTDLAALEVELPEEDVAAVLAL